MDRIASSEEKIRRAEEIYYRRRNETNRNNVARVNVNDQKNYGLFKKLILQILICLVIYFIFYLIQNGNYIFSENVINKTKEILSYDINIPQTYEQVKQFINNANLSTQNANGENSVDANTVNNTEGNSTEQNNTNEQENGNAISNEQTGENENNVNNGENSENGENAGSSENSANSENNETGENVAAIGGADFEDVVLEQAKEQTETKTQEQLDIERLQTFSWTKPVNGTVTSEFGIREQTSAIVSKNHTGIDVGANTGTVIVAAIEGTVEISSSYGEYGKHIKITNGDVSTLYAHCSKLYVNAGDYVQKGQEIAEVGSTGKSTGPHLHFEVIREGRYINPRNVLEF